MSSQLLSSRCFKLTDWSIYFLCEINSLPLPFTWIPSSSGILHGVGWLSTDVAGLHIGLIFTGQDVKEVRRIDSWRRDRYVVSKRRFVANLRCVTFQKTKEFIYLFFSNSTPKAFFIGTWLFSFDIPRSRGFTDCVKIASVSASCCLT
jgi:hypothetical protein